MTAAQMIALMESRLKILGVKAGPVLFQARQISRPIAGGSSFGACTLGSRPQAMFMCEVRGLTELS